MKVHTVSDLIVDTLQNARVERVYGLPGDSLNGITEALRSRGAIEWVHVRHEKSGAFAAAGEAHMTGRLAVCAGSCGPGNTHLVNSLFDAHRSRVPSRSPYAPPSASGSFQIWLARHLYSFRARQILITNGQQTLGVGPPRGIAATLLRPGGKVSQSRATAGPCSPPESLRWPSECVRHRAHGLDGWLV